MPYLQKKSPGLNSKHLRARTLPEVTQKAKDESEESWSHYTVGRVLALHVAYVAPISSTHMDSRGSQE